MATTAKTAEVGNNVTVHYVGTFEDGTEFDSSHKRGEPIEFEVGAGMMIPGFDQAVVGMAEGDEKTVNLEPIEAYGDRDERRMQPVPMSAFGPDYEFTVGAVVQGQQEGRDTPFLAKIHALHEETKEVVLDLNHPLAGKNLNFNIEMVKIA